MRKTVRRLVIASAVILLSGLACENTATRRPTRETSLRVHPGLSVELVASEPQVMDPIAIEWGPDGKLWVVEMADYPMGLDGKGKSGGRIRFLEDTDGDGRYDRSVLFLDGLSYPTGVLPWRDGILVTCAPDIFFAADTDGDGSADTRETLFTGFGEVNPQHRANGLRWGLDNWIYCANGDFAEIRDRSASALQWDYRGPAPGARRHERRSRTHAERWSHPLAPYGA